MPPSGFNEKAIQGLLQFIGECYEDILKEIDNGLEPRAAIKKELDTIKSFLKGFYIK